MLALGLVGRNSAPWSVPGAVPAIAFYMQFHTNTLHCTALPCAARVRRLARWQARPCAPRVAPPVADQTIAPWGLKQTLPPPDRGYRAVSAVAQTVNNSNCKAISEKLLEPLCSCFGHAVFGGKCERPIGCQPDPRPRPRN